ncbi:MAG: DoxX family protein [Candidatus Kapabacteria bacterium]|nr:DoxX family protein [Candidatus Kapabacteria bacterium]
MQKIFSLLSKPMFSDIGFLLLRILVGCLMIYHGYPKFLDTSKLITRTAEMGFPFPEVFGTLAMAAEFFGGMLLVIGLGTRFALLGIIITMAVACFIAHGPDPFAKKELAFVFMCVSIAMIFIGSGKYSVDSLVLSKTSSKDSE